MKPIAILILTAACVMGCTDRNGAPSEAEAAIGQAGDSQTVSIEVAGFLKLSGIT